MDLFKIIDNEAGFVVSTELILVSTLLVLGMIVGQTTLRDQLVTEIADGADAISALDQSYSFSNIEVATHGSVAGTTFSDAADFCDASDNGAQGQNAFFTGTCTTIDGNDNSSGSQTTTGSATAN